MPLFPWIDVLSVGNKTLDNQHKKWVDMFNDMAEQMKLGKGNEIAMKHLQGMIDYTKQHFAYEEDVMKKVNYPDLQRHKEMHNALVKKLQELYQKAQSGQMMLSVDVMRTLRDWLFTHITESDKKYSPYLK